jgi:hypothetical protein
MRQDTSRANLTLANAEAIYDYPDAAGIVRFKVARYANPNEFRPWRPDGRGGWVHGLEGVALVPYHLPLILKSDLAVLSTAQRARRTRIRSQPQGYSPRPRKVARTVGPRAHLPLWMPCAGAQ